MQLFFDQPRLGPTTFSPATLVQMILGHLLLVLLLHSCYSMLVFLLQEHDTMQYSTTGFDRIEIEYNSSWLFQDVAQLWNLGSTHTTIERTIKRKLRHYYSTEHQWRLAILTSGLAQGPYTLIGWGGSNAASEAERPNVSTTVSSRPYCWCLFHSFWTTRFFCIRWCAKNSLH